MAAIKGAPLIRSIHERMFYAKDQILAILTYGRILILDLNYAPPWKTLDQKMSGWSQSVYIVHLMTCYNIMRGKR